MRSLGLWRLCDELNIVQAALLLCEYENPDIWEYVENWDLEKRPPGYEAMKTAVTAAIRTERVKGKIQFVDSSVANVGSSIDYYESLVEVDSLKEWLSTKGHSNASFVTGKPIPRTGLDRQGSSAGRKTQGPPANWRSHMLSVSPDYLNKDHPCYSPKLAAAIHAWEALQADTQYRDNGKSIKSNLDAWLTAHAADFDLVNEAGDAMKTTIGELAKVANWSTGGGAPKTPERNLPVGNENLPPSFEATEDGGFDDDEFHIPIPKEWNQS
jgi:hypothetical protein